MITVLKRGSSQKGEVDTHIININMKRAGIIVIAAIIAIVLPLALCKFIYPAAQIFLPEGNIVLTPLIRITCTIIMAIIDYVVAGFILIKYCKEWFGKVWPHLITGMLTFIWNVCVGVLWYIVMI